MNVWAGLVLAEALVFAATWFAAPVYWDGGKAAVVVVCSAICLGASLFAMIPIALVGGQSRPALGNACRWTTGLRLGLSLLASVAYFVIANPPPTFFVACMAAWYLVVMAVQTGMALFTARVRLGQSP